MYTTTTMMATETAPFMLMRKLCEGSCGSIYSGSLTATRKRVAVKVVRKGQSAQAQRNLCRARNEANTMVQMDHRNVLRCLGTWETSDHFYLFLKYARGGSLSDRLLYGGAMSERSARKHFGRLLAAVAHVHAQGIVHGNIAPQHVLLDEQGHFMLAGFGQAAKLTTTSSKNSRRERTPSYSAPEVWLGPQHNDPAVDVFSCGAVLMAMLTGQTPFAASSDEKSLARVLRGDLALPPSLSLEAHHLIMCMVEPDPKRRFTLADVLDHPWLTGEELTVDTLIHDNDEGRTSTNARDDDDDCSDDSDDDEDGEDGEDQEDEEKVFHELVKVMADDCRMRT